MKESICIRRIKVSDYQAIYRLNCQLKYEYEEEKVCKRIMSLLESSSDIMLVAEYEGKVVGYVHGTPYETLYVDVLMNILAFVIDDAYDDDEVIADALLQEFEKQAKHFGFHGLRFVADKERILAQKFFAHHDFDSHRDLKHFIKYFK